MIYTETFILAYYAQYKTLNMTAGKIDVLHGKVLLLLANVRMKGFNFFLCIGLHVLVFDK